MPSPNTHIIARLKAMMSPCRLCPRECGAMRAEGERGWCGVGAKPMIAGWDLHMGEESFIRGERGAGAVFFSGCNLKCITCFAWEISHECAGEEITPEQLAQVFVELEARGASCLDLITPTHQAPGWAEALKLAREQGVGLEVVYNTGGYESVQTLEILSPMIGVYLTDIKTASSAHAEVLMGAGDYFPRAMEAIEFMLGQLGALEPETTELKGVVVRHLMLPGGWSDTEEVLRAVARLRPTPPVNLMGHYLPVAPGIERAPSVLGQWVEETQYRRMRELALELGLKLVE